VKLLGNKRRVVCKKCKEFSHYGNMCKHIDWDVDNPSSPFRHFAPRKPKYGWCTYFEKNRWWWTPIEHNVAGLLPLVMITSVVLEIVLVVLHKVLHIL
jgi:hypothetical protein